MNQAQPLSENDRKNNPNYEAFLRSVFVKSETAYASLHTSLAEQRLRYALSMQDMVWERGKMAIDLYMLASETHAQAEENAQLRAAVQPKAPEASAALREDVARTRAAKDKGNFALLRGRTKVTLATAGLYLGIGRRAVEQAIKKNKLDATGARMNRRVTVDSLIGYCPPTENTN